MSIEVYISNSHNPWQNLTMEKYFLLDHPKKEKNIYLFFYENLPSIILGQSLKISDEVFLHKRYYPVLKRLSGGGSVVHFIGNLNFSIFLSLKEYTFFYDIKNSYELILNSIIDSFKSKIILAKKGLSDLSVLQAGQFRKISGNSQARKKGFLLHHGTFIYNSFPVANISYYLKMPSKQPTYRENRQHKDFMLKVCPISKSQTIFFIMKAMQKLFKTEINLKCVDSSSIISIDDLKHLCP